ncbi:class I SAM-dependent RNA methyltransferase [Cellulomonas taurus]|uniref:class I SAM-dependent RNA methyltransferase n=1 Tax=Cellulomonas taurus TaxID=2729175 RepID=UPI00145FBFCA|nr:TRAM domain-containing protein [Cellulomonas taurus]
MSAGRRAEGSDRRRKVATEPVPRELIELEVGPVAHGGHCVARMADGRVVFVRHALPGERVMVRVTETGPKFWRADAVEVLDASADRVESVWPEAGPGGVGGGELAHVRLDAQRAWKSSVLTEQLSRLARIDREVPVAGVPEDNGLGWRTRVSFVADAEGRLGMRKFRSHDLVPLTSMPLMSDALADLGLLDRRWTAGVTVDAVAPAGGDQPIVLVDGQPFDLRRGKVDPRPHARSTVREVVGDWQYRVAAAGFWQVHRQAPSTLVDAVLAGIGDTGAGAVVLDLFAGAGLFTLPLADRVGDSGRVVAVEGDARAVKDARRNAHDRPQIELHQGDVSAVLGTLGEWDAVDAIVLDPPRVGAGREVVRSMAALDPARIVYVACDPAALARDVAYLVEEGYELRDVQGFDLFPMTHHVEAVAVLER